MIVVNPTPNLLQVNILGIDYVVEPNSSLAGVSPEAAAYWKVKLHTFIELHDEAPKGTVAVPVKDAPKELVEKVKATSTTTKKK